LVQELAEIAQDSSKSDTVKSIGRAVEVLQALSRNLRKISEIAPALKLSNSTVHRLLQTLRESGLVVQDPVHHEYYLGNLLVQLAFNPLVNHQYLIYCAHQKMDQLRQFSGETVTLHVKVGIQRFRLEILMGPRNLTVVGRPGLTDRIWIGATGKALLSRIDKKDFEVLMDHVILDHLTPNSITDREVFKKEIGKVRELGYAVSRGETDSGVTGVSVPILDYPTPATITISGPDDRIFPRIPNLVPELKKKAAEISQDWLKVAKH
jgi:DNA-binding IclR family transcriptional regulator